VTTTRGSGKSDGAPRGSAAGAVEGVEEWARSWFRGPNGEDRLSIDGLPIGPALTIEVFESVLEAVRRTVGGPRQSVGQSRLRPLRRSGLDRAVRAWGLRVVAPAVGGVETPAGRVGIVSEMATPSALEASMVVAAALPRSEVVIGAADPRAFRRWRAAGYRPVGLELTPADEIRRIRAASRQVRRIWPDLKDSVPPLVVADRDMTREAVAAIEPLVRRSAPWLTVEAAAVERFLSRSGVRVLLLASDQHRVGRLAAHLARSAGTCSVVLQHGLPQASLGYVPVVADLVAAWSEAAVGWFIDRGTAPQQLTVVGNPRFDELLRRDHSADRLSIEAETGLHGSPRLLLTLSVASTEVNLHLLEVTLGALRRLEAASLIVKLHPGGSDWSTLQRRLAAPDVPKARVRTVERAPLYPLLGWADVVVVHRSTVAGEALVAGRPIVVLSAGEPSIADTELASLDLLTADDAAGLAALVTDLSPPSAAAGFLAERQDRLATVMGPLDGGSVARLVALVHTLANSRETGRT
jgi:hypothetical protein